MRSIPFNKYRKLGIFSSAFVILFSILVVIVNGFNFSIDFTGGIVLEFKQKGDEVTPAEVRESLKNLRLQDYSVQSSADVIIVRIGLKNQTEAVNLVQKIKDRLVYDFENTALEFIKIDFVSPQISKELGAKAVFAVLISLISILLYIGIRFELRYSLGAILALLHDVILTLGFISIFSLSFDISTIAAILTVVGYSINDSVVIFDRIRENFKLSSKNTSNGAVIEKSLNAILSRTIITSATTLIAIFAIILIGGSILRPFALIIFFGIFVGTVSSIFIAPMPLYNKKQKSK